MDTLVPKDLEKLVRHRNGRAVTIYMATHPGSPEGLQDGVRLKNLLVQAEESLVEKGVRAPEARKLLKPATELIDNDAFWHDRTAGLAIFLGEETFRTLRAPIAFREESSVGSCFRIKQLLPLITDTGQADVLALSRNRLRLLAVTHDGYQPVAASLPENMEAALNIEGADPGEQVHAAAHAGMSSRIGKQAAVFHGQGGRADTLKDDIEQYFGLVADALHEVLHKRPAPLVLAGVEYELSIFRKVCRYPGLESDELHGNFDHASDHELYEQARPIVSQILKRPRLEAAQKYQDFTDTKATSDDLRTVLIAAHRGRVDTLFVDVQSEAMGHFDAETEMFDRHHTADADDLLETAATATLNKGGIVFGVTREEMPCVGSVAAIFRYESA